MSSTDLPNEGLIHPTVIDRILHAPNNVTDTDLSIAISYLQAVVEEADDAGRFCDALADVIIAGVLWAAGSGSPKATALRLNARMYERLGTKD